MESELQSIEDNKTWTLCRPPRDRRVIGTKWVYKTKRDGNNNFLRYKARLVAKGYSQIVGLDFEETYAHVVRIDSVRCLFAIAAFFGLHIVHVDAKTAFLNGESRYLKYSHRYSITYGRAPNLNILGYADADWESDENDRTSFTGYVFMINNGAVTWTAHQQSSVALSTMEAKYMSLSDASREAIARQHFFDDLRIFINTQSGRSVDRIKPSTVSTFETYRDSISLHSPSRAKQHDHDRLRSH
jgi:hypothetical protein